MNRPWMPLYVADYLADTTHLSTAEHGAYLLLIMHYWQNEGLPTDERKLARIARMSFKEWSNIQETIFDFFDANWRHERIDGELKKVREISDKRRIAGGKRGSNSSANAQQMHGQMQNNSAHTSHFTDSQSETQTQEKERIVEERASARPEGWKSRDGKIEITPTQMAEWQAAFPEVNIRGELIRSQVWAAGRKDPIDAFANLLGKKNEEMAKAKLEATVRARAGAEANNRPRPPIV